MLRPWYDVRETFWASDEGFDPRCRRSPRRRSPSPPPFKRRSDRSRCAVTPGRDRWHTTGLYEDHEGLVHVRDLQPDYLQPICEKTYWAGRTGLSGRWQPAQKIVQEYGVSQLCPPTNPSMQCESIICKVALAVAVRAMFREARHPHAMHVQSLSRNVIMQKGRYRTGFPHAGRASGGIGNVQGAQTETGTSSGAARRTSTGAERRRRIAAETGTTGIGQRTGRGTLAAAPPRGPGRELPQTLTGRQPAAAETSRATSLPPRRTGTLQSPRPQKLTKLTTPTTSPASAQALQRRLALRLHRLQPLSSMEPLMQLATARQPMTSRLCQCKAPMCKQLL